MVKYEVRIDGTTFDRLLTLDELLDNGLLDDYDPNIQVRAKGESKWITALDYPYSEKENSPSADFMVNEDGSVTVSDITTIASFILGNNPSPFNKTNADVDKDGDITVSDITGTAGIILGN